MRATTAAYVNAYQTGATYVARVEVLNASGTILRDSSTFEVVSGIIEVDRSASFRRRLSRLVLLDLDGTITPDQASDLFSVTSGNEIRIYAGYRVDGVDALYSQGIFGLEGAEVEDTLDGVTVTLSAFDRSRKVSRNKSYRPFIITQAENTIAAARRFLEDRMPGVVISAPTTTFTTPYTVIDAERDPWEVLQDLMRSIGFEIFFNTDGVCVMQIEPDPDNVNLAISWTYQEGTTATTLRINRSSSNEDVPNFVIVTGENSYNITPARGLAWDNDQTSSTYAGDPTAVPPVPPGSYGLVLESTTDKLVSTQAQANAAAASRLTSVKGATEVVTFSIVPNPAHEEGDLVRVVRSRTNLDARLVVERFSIPLQSQGSPEMAMTTRKRKI